MSASTALNETLGPGSFTLISRSPSVTVRLVRVSPGTAMKSASMASAATASARADQWTRPESRALPWGNRIAGEPGKR
jgi:hypothetical protein